MTKLTTTAFQALHATRRLRWISERSATQPILGYIKAKGTKDGLLLTGTNIDCELEIKVPGEGEGEMLLPLEGFHKVFGSTTGDVVLEKVGDKAQGRVGNFNVNYPTLDVKNFPTLSPGKTPTAGFTALADFFGWATQYPEHAIATDEKYPNGLFIHWSKFEGGKEGLASIATDGHQLVRCNIGSDASPLGSLKPSNFEGIIPRNAILLLNKLLLDIDAESGEKIAVRQYDGKNGKVVFAATDWKLTTKCLSGAFPNYMKIVPKTGAKHRITVDAALLEGATKAMKTLEKAVRIEASGNELLVSLKSEAGEALEIVEAEVSSPITFSVNIRYLLNALSNCATEAVIELDSATSTIRVIDPDQDEIAMLVMPERRAGDAAEVSAIKALPKPKVGSTKEAAKPAGAKKPAKTNKKAAAVQAAA